MFRQQQNHWYAYPNSRSTPIDINTNADQCARCSRYIGSVTPKLFILILKKQHSQDNSIQTVFTCNSILKTTSMMLTSTGDGVLGEALLCFSVCTSSHDTTIADGSDTGGPGSVHASTDDTTIIEGSTTRGTGSVAATSCGVERYIPMCWLVHPSKDLF